MHRRHEYGARRARTLGHIPLLLRGGDGVEVVDGHAVTNRCRRRVPSVVVVARVTAEVVGLCLHPHVGRAWEEERLRL